MSNIIELKHAAKIHGCGADNIVAEVVRITPAVATSWLRANKKNRPVRKRHVVFLAQEILAGNWQVNGQAIVIADNENVLDGQHRLLAVIEAGHAIDTLVVYGIPERAFATIDTGAVRTGADALCLHFEEFSTTTVKTVATAVQWVRQLERGLVHNFHRKISNTEIIEYAKEHLSLFQHSERLQSYPKDNRPLSIGVGTACYEMFARKDEEIADEYMRSLYTGEGLTRDDVEWHLRQSFQKDAQRTTTKLQTPIKVRMVIKGWNWRRRGMPTASYQTIQVSTKDDQRITIM
jgi:hypothetical protein